MIVLDTNVVSQLYRPDGSRAVAAWLDLQHAETIRTTAITIMEIRLGLELLPEGQRKATLTAFWTEVFDARFVGGTLAFDHVAAEIAGRLTARRTRSGLNIDTTDTQIAAIAIAHGATLATRNTRHFADLPIEVIDPWTA